MLNKPWTRIVAAVKRRFSFRDAWVYLVYLLVAVGRWFSLRRILKVAVWSMVATSALVMTAGFLVVLGGGTLVVNAVCRDYRNAREYRTAVRELNPLSNAVVKQVDQLGQLRIRELAFRQGAEMMEKRGRSDMAAIMRLTEKSSAVLAHECCKMLSVHVNAYNFNAKGFSDGVLNDLDLPRSFPEVKCPAATDEQNGLSPPDDPDAPLPMM
ncbi:MAG: hypothetical protein PHT12_03760 [Patescibacteria group bacterium]|nr:hypothetical protein [Patescibacteria group bacterium]